MNLGIFNELINNKKRELINNFIKEIESYLILQNRKATNNMEQEIENYKEEDCLYQVVDKSASGVYLQNTKNNIVFEETDISNELLEKLETDFIVRYKNGEYVFEEEITDDFLNSLLSIGEYKEIQDKFINESGVLDLAPDEIFTISERDENCTILKYGSSEENTISVPNALLPYFVYDETTLKFENGKFIIV